MNIYVSQELIIMKDAHITSIVPLMNRRAVAIKQMQWLHVHISFFNFTMGIMGMDRLPWSAILYVSNESGKNGIDRDLDMGA